MAASTVAYTDTTGNKDYLGMIASQIGKRLKQASDMASEERAYASRQAEMNNTSLEEAGIGRGHFFKRALGSRFGGDKIARTRGRLGATGPGTDPSKSYKQRFRGGFDYNYSEQINQVTRDVGGAIVPMSSALSVGLRGVEGGLTQVSQSVSALAVSMSSLAKTQDDMAREVMMMGAFMRAFMTYMQRQQQRSSARNEERVLEGGRRRLGGRGGRGPINITPGSGGGGRLAGSGSGVGGASNIFNTSQSVARLGVQANRTINTAKSAVSSGVKAANQLDVGGAIVRSGGTVAKFVPDAAKIGRNAAKLLKVPAAALGNFFGTAVRGVKNAPGIGSLMALRQVLMEQSVGGMLGKGGFRSQLKRFITGPDYFADGFQSSYGNVLEDLLGREGAPKNIHAQTLEDMIGDSSLARAGNVIDVPVKSSASEDLARVISAEEAQKLAAMRMAQGDQAGIKAAEMATDAIVKRGTKEGLKKGSALARMMVKQFGAAGTKSILKKIPVVAGVAGILFGIQRAMEGDFLGAGLEITSGLLGATGVGAPVGLGIDGFLLARDLGMMPMARGGFLTKPTPVVAGEAGAEGFFPLEGARGKATFKMFGEGVLNAQKDNKSDVANLYALGNKRYYEGMGGWKSFGESLKGIFSGLGDLLPDNPLGGLLNAIGLGGDEGRAGSYKIDASKFADGVYGTGLVTGPAGQIGAGTEYHLDSKFSKDMSMEDRVKLMDQLARGYAARGREIEFSNDAVRGTIYDPSASLEEKIALLRKVQNAHSHSLHADYDSIDYYIPNIGKGREHESAEGAEILMPTMHDAQLRYGQGGGYGAFTDLIDKDGKILFTTGHGDIRGAKTGTVDLSPPKTTPQADLLSRFRSLNTAGDQANQLNQNSMFSGMFGGGMMMPTTVINNNYAAATSGSGVDDSFGAGFDSTGFSPFVFDYNIINKQ